MGINGWLVFAVLAVLGLTVYLSWTAGRIDRLHARIDAAKAALDAQLVRRASVTLELATSGLLDPATSVLLAGAAHEAMQAGPDARELAESDLSRALRAAFAEPVQRDTLERDPAGAVLFADLGAVTRRSAMARRFHNDAVRATLAVRRQRLVRYLRLAGRAPMPTSFEMDDVPPESLARESAL